MRTPYPQRTFYSADLDQTLGALGLEGRAVLQLEPLSGRAGKAAKAGKTVASAASAQNALPGNTADQGAPKATKPTPAVFVLQVRHEVGMSSSIAGALWAAYY